MGTSMYSTKRNRGFTIVELLIVIVVIGILASITIVAYSGVQQRARDAKRHSDVSTLVKSMTLWAVYTGKQPIDSGAGYNNNGTGWVYAGDFQGSFGGYSINIEDVLADATGLPQGGVRDPLTPTGNGSYMFYQCSTVSAKTTYAFFARLEGAAPTSNNGDMARWKAEGCSTAPLKPEYGMNFAQMFTL